MVQTVTVGLNFFFLLLKKTNNIIRSIHKTSTIRIIIGKALTSISRPHSKLPPQNDNKKKKKIKTSIYIDDGDAGCLKFD